MATQNEAQQAIIDRIAEMAPAAPTAEKLLALAEAYAWAAAPNNTHG